MSKWKLHGKQKHKDMNLQIFYNQECFHIAVYLINIASYVYLIKILLKRSFRPECYAFVYLHISQ